jgi:metal-sulfur cluster biosynthetic enzyme
MTGGADSTLASAVRDGLRMVIDPELGENIIDLGLIYDLAVEAGVARITMTTTMPGCPATDYLREAVQAAALSVPGITGADVQMTYEPPWSPDMINEAAGRRA